MKRIFFSLSFVVTVAHAVCVVNPGEIGAGLGKVSYVSMFPVKVAGFSFGDIDTLREGLDMVPNVFCTCPGKLGGFPQIGIPVGFYNPDRTIDIVKDKFCFPSLGLDLETGVPFGDGSDSAKTGPEQNKHFFQAHLSIFPFAAIVGFLKDLLCLSPANYFDMAHITEVDPLWNNDETATLTTPEALLFAHPIGVAACIADAAASQFMPIDPLFWCQGSWGSAYPLTGTQHNGSEQTQHIAAAAKYIFKSYREMRTWKQSGMSSLCFPHPMPIWIKSSSRLQLAYPIPTITGLWIGQSELIWGWMKNMPEVPNKYYFWFRKFDCCFL